MPLVYNLCWQRKTHFQWCFTVCDSLTTFTKRWKRKVYFSHKLLVYSTELQWKRISLKIKDNYWQASEIFLSDHLKKKCQERKENIYKFPRWTITKSQSCIFLKWWCIFASTKHFQKVLETALCKGKIQNMDNPSNPQSSADISPIQFGGQE